ncbi:MAG: hypothetical protein JNK58_05240 [Phycisphaerae bacterium]|nr:hypothetical protein [Phycisphaerae bacterium]
MQAQVAAGEDAGNYVAAVGERHSTGFVVNEAQRHRGHQSGMLTRPWTIVVIADRSLSARCHWLLDTCATRLLGRA